jgi:hypothetical protein
MKDGADSHFSRYPREYHLSITIMSVWPEYQWCWRIMMFVLSTPGILTVSLGYQTVSYRYQSKIEVRIEDG